MGKNAIIRISIITIHLAFFCITSFAQEADTLAEESPKPKIVTELYGSLYVQSRPLYSSRATETGLAVGATFLNKIGLEVSYGEQISHHNKKIIYPRQFEFNSINAGVKLNYQIINYKKISLHPFFGTTFNQSSWTESDKNEVFERKNHIIYSPGLEILYRLNGLVAGSFSLGYHIAGSVDMVDLVPQNLDGVFFQGNIRLGKISVTKQPK